MKRNRLIERKSWCKHSNLEAAAATFLALLVAFVIRAALHPFLDDGIPTFTFMIATILIAYHYGYKWGVLTLTIGFIIATYFFIKPYNSFDLPSETDLYRMGYYFSITIIVVIVFEKINRSKYESELLAKLSDEQYRAMVTTDKTMRELTFPD